MEDTKQRSIAVPSYTWMQVAPGVQVWQDSGCVQVIDGDPSRAVKFRIRFADDFSDFSQPQGS